MATSIQYPSTSSLTGFRVQLLSLLARFTCLGLLVVAFILYLADNPLYLLAIPSFPVFLICSTDRYLDYRTRTWLVISLFLIYGAAIAFSRMEPIGGRIFVICGACLTCILLGLRPALATLVVGLLGLYLPYVLYSLGLFSPASHLAIAPIMDWHVQISGGMVPGLVLLLSFNFAITWLIRSESRAKLVTDHAADIIWNIDMNQRVNFVTPSVEKMLGYSEAEVLGQPVSSVLTSRKLAAGVENTIKSGSNDIVSAFSSESFELELTHKQGHGVWTEIKVQTIYDEAGNPTGLSGVTRDISSRKQAEAKQTVLEAQLRQAQKMESVGQLAGGVAHDFNNLLAVIQGYAELIQDPATSPMEIQNCAKEISKSSERAASLTHQLLLFSRKKPADPKPISINRLIANLENMLVRLLPETIQLQCSLDHGTKAIAGDVGQLEQVLVNLVVNAKDATEENGTIRIETENAYLDEDFAERHSWSRVGEFTRITVADTGKGIPEDVQPQIFEPFFTSKELGKGTGLGLSVVFGIINQHEGFINFETSPQGTTFYIYLPTVEQEAIPLPEKNVVLPVSGSERILVIEDNESLRELACKVLERAGYQVIAAEDGEAGLNLFQTNDGKFDLVFSDVVLPKLSGGELGRKIRSSKPSVPILFASGYSTDDENLSELIQDGARVLTKPYKAADLLRNVRTAIDGQHVA